MLNIIQARIDERLLHGQIATRWVKALKVNRIVVVDDEVRDDIFMCNILISLAPKDLIVDVFNLREAAAFLKSPAGNEGRVLLLARAPIIFKRVMDEGIVLTCVTLGAMGMKPGRSSLLKNLALTEEERKLLKELLDNGVQIVYHEVPHIPAVNLIDYL